jgi:hypothetical protein
MDVDKINSSNLNLACFLHHFSYVDPEDKRSLLSQRRRASFKVPLPSLGEGFRVRARIRAGDAM